MYVLLHYFQIIFICDALRNLVTFVQFKKRTKHLWRSINKVTLLHGCFSSFLNCTNGTKSRKASNIISLFGWNLVCRYIIIELYKFQPDRTQYVIFTPHRNYLHLSVSLYMNHCLSLAFTIWNVTKVKYTKRSQG